mgnify:CR=1 FL=1
MFNLLNPLSLLTNPGARQAGLQAFGGAKEMMGDPDYKRMFQFGVIDNSLLVVMMLAGLGIDGWIEKKVGVKGYGPIAGLLAGNAMRNGASAMPQGPASAFGAVAGSLVPALPVAIAVYSKKPLTGLTHKAVLASAVGLLAWQYMQRGTASNGAANV